MYTFGPSWIYISIRNTAGLIMTHIQWMKLSHTVDNNYNTISLSTLLVYTLLYYINDNNERMALFEMRCHALLSNHASTFHLQKATSTNNNIFYYTHHNQLARSTYHYATHYASSTAFSSLINTLIFSITSICAVYGL